MKIRVIDALVIAGLILCASALRGAQATLPAGAEQLLVGAGKTRLLDTAVDIERVSIAAPEIAEAVPVSARSLMVNGKTAGETSLVIWLTDGSRREYDVDVKLAASRIQAAKDQIATEFGEDVQVAVSNASVYLTGRVRDLYAANRAVSIAETIGKVVNLLKVDVPEAAQQILLKVRFADVDRSKERDLGINFFGVAQGVPFTATTGQFSSTVANSLPAPGAGGATTPFSLADSLNLFMFDPHLNIGDTIKALESSSVLEILAEPNVLAINGKEAGFVAGGEFPYPTLQGGGSGIGQVTIQFREFGVRLHFTPTVTPRGTIRLHVTPEVSSLDYADSLSISGFTIPALSTRRVDTEVELQSGQSFAIAGLLDNNTTESLSKIPGLANIPVLGKLFTSKTITKTNSELLVIVTPELVAPIPEGQPLPDMPRPTPFLEGPGILNQPPRTPGTDQTGPAPARAKRSEISVQEMERIQRDQQNPATAPASSPGMSTPTLPGFGGAATGNPSDPAGGGLAPLAAGTGTGK
jgi:pilus assembly protein CpaC